MDEYKDKIKIQICMGSSCFARGNKISIGIIQEYLKQHDLSADIQLNGCLCENKCNTGPHISIGSSSYSEVEPGSVKDLLNHHFKVLQK